MGMANALSTYCTQAFGKKDFYLCGIYCWRARFILFIANLFLAILLWKSEEIFLALEIPEDLAKYSAQYCKGMIPATLIYCQFDITRRFLNAQGIYNCITVIYAISAVVCPPTI